MNHPSTRLRVGPELIIVTAGASAQRQKCACRGATRDGSARERTGASWRRLPPLVSIDETGVMSAPYEALSNSAHLVFLTSIGAFAAGELLQTFRSRRGATRVDMRAEILFRV